MKVGVLTSRDDLCGIAQYSRDLCAGLDMLVHLDIVRTRQPSESWAWYLRHSVERLNQCDVIHVQHEYSFWGSILPVRNRYFAHMARMRPPKILTAHTLDTAREMLLADSPGTVPVRAVKALLARSSAYCDSVERRTFDLADRIIVHDRPAESVLQSRGIAADKIRVIPMGVPAPNADAELGAAFRRKYGLDGRQVVVIFGFARPGRGYEAVLDVISQFPNTSLVIAGGCRTSEDELYVRKLRDAAGEQLLVTGFLADQEVAGVLHAADVALCAQDRGTGSYSLQVVLGYGLPVLASDLPCFVELEDGWQCLLTFVRGDKADLASKLGLILDDGGLRERLASRALVYAAEHLWNRIAADTVQVYRELVDA